VRHAFIVFLATRPGAPPWDRAALRVQRAKGRPHSQRKNEKNALEVDAVTCSAWPLRLGNLPKSDFSGMSF
jgi:hypothetical protein